MKQDLVTNEDLLKKIDAALYELSKSSSPEHKKFISQVEVIYTSAKDELIQKSKEDSSRDLIKKILGKCRGFLELDSNYNYPFLKAMGDTEAAVKKWLL